ncbi:MAG: glycosyltransferase family 39 protein [Kiritimatiellaeota bacterium]|nr:glycosyltransferase family 39 protein [Kiritimatiellota bacterium]
MPEHDPPVPQPTWRKDAPILFGLAAVFLLRILSWAVADLWFDEVITLSDYAVGPQGANSLWRVFRVYPVANNHVLFSALLWVWVRLVGFSSSEWVLRLPSIACGVLTVVLTARLWQDWIGRRQAFLAALLTAVSPVVAPFTFQLRGYSLSLLLGTIAVAGVMELTEGCRNRGLRLTVPTFFLLTVVIPVNALVVGALLLFLLTCPDPLRPGLKDRVRRYWPAGLAAALGCAYWLTLGERFFRALSQTTGWPNTWAAAGNLLLAIGAHAGPFLVVIPAMLLVPRLRRRYPLWTEGAPPGYLALTALAVIAMVLAVRRPAPYPRVFVVFFPLFTFSLFRVARNMPLFDNAYQTRLMAMVILMLGAGWERGAAALTRKQVLAGGHPQNLLQQYYRGSTALSQICSRLAATGAASRTVVLVDFFDFPGFRFYWTTVFKQPAERVLAEHLRPEAQWEARFKGRDWRLGAVAVNWEEAGRLFAAAECPGPFVLAFTAEDRGFFVRGEPPPVKRKSTGPAPRRTISTQ